MASQYLGTTAASSVSNPPVLLLSPFGGTHNTPCPGGKIWGYQSTNTTTEVTTAGFFTDGQALGMQVGDIVMGVYQTSVGSSSPYPYMGCIATASSTGCTLGTATT